MAANFTVRKQRLENLIRQFQAGNIGEDATKDLAELGKAHIRANWSGNYPPASDPGNYPAVRTGNLDQRTQVRRVKAGHHQIVNDAEYALPLEYGTVKMAARPFMRPTAEWLRQQASRVAGDKIRIEVLKAVK